MNVVLRAADGSNPSFPDGAVQESCKGYMLCRGLFTPRRAAARELR